MISKQKIRKLAIIAAGNNTIPEDIEMYVLKVLSKQELKMFLRFYKNALNKRRVYIETADTISADNMKILKELYKDKEIMINTNSQLGAGLILTDDDMIVDFTFKKYINDTIEKLRN